MARFCWSCDKTYPSDKVFCERDGARLVLREGWAGKALANRYRLEGLIGQGGFGQVYVATVEESLPDEGLVAGSAVAVKIITRMGQMPESWAKIKNSQKRETEVARKIKHEGLIRIFESGDDRELDCLYIIMQLGGRDLSNVLADEGPRSGASDFRYDRWCQRVVRISAQIAEALSALHSHEIYHRDIKPQNVMEMAGRMVLIDYGIAKDLHAATQTKSSDGVWGTPEYMCPDYSLSTGTVQWAQVDQYAFGVMLYELLTGTLPFDAPDGPGRSMAIYDQHLHKAPEPLHARQSGVPAECEKLVLRLLEKSPDKRFPSMAAVGKELHALIPRKTTPTERSTPAPAGANHAVEIAGLETQVDKDTGKTVHVLRF